MMDKEANRSIVVFFLTASIVLSAAPAINFFASGFSKNLYDLDFAVRWTSRVLAPWGVSVDPHQAIVGRGGWLHLGDRYRETVSVDRREAGEIDSIKATNVKAAITAWGSELQSDDVKAFLLMVGPNKSAVYPETAPLWARPANTGPIDNLLADPGPHLLDLRPALLAERQKSIVELYYRTDTHWNALGAATAFRALAEKMQKEKFTITWPKSDAYSVRRVLTRRGGDLARFLHLEEEMVDLDPELAISDWPTTVTHIDWASGTILARGPNSPVQAPSTPLLVQSTGALNEAKVLWIRDSFGVALSPFMAATFSQVLQLHVNQAYADGKLLELVQTFKPDFVFVTVVQRDALSDFFTTFPPSGGTRAISGDSSTHEPRHY